MASSNPSTAGVQNPKRSLGFVANAIKRKESFFQFFVMTGILLLSLRSVGQKYRINDLQEDTSALKEEQKVLADRMSHIKRSLLAEAALDPTGHFATRLRTLFGNDDWVIYLGFSTYSSFLINMNFSVCLWTVFELFKFCWSINCIFYSYQTRIELNFYELAFVWFWYIFVTLFLCFNVLEFWCRCEVFKLWIPFICILQLFNWLW